jgi:hypothetical protein
MQAQNKEQTWLDLNTADLSTGAACIVEIRSEHRN